MVMIVERTARLWLTGPRIALPSEIIPVLILRISVFHVNVATVGWTVVLLFLATTGRRLLIQIDNG